jgi:hypothetical protein
MPGFVDPYYVVSVDGGGSTEEFREVEFGGRTFRIPISPAAAPTSFVRVADGFDPRDERWMTATRSGITTVQLVSRGFGESVITQVVPDEPKLIAKDSAGLLYLALTNQTASLEVLRKGLAGDKKKKDEGSTPSAADRMALIRARMAQRSGGRGAPEQKPAVPTETAKPTEEKPKTGLAKLWDEARKGEDTLFVNVNNSSAILYLVKEASEAEDAKLALVADGDDLFRTVDQLDSEQFTIVMPPRINLVPNSRDRVNVARMLSKDGFELAFSQSLNQNDFRNSQESPLFAVSMLVRAGLDRDKAIKALTIVPARLIGIEKEAGSIEKGKRADLVVLDDEPFSATARVIQVLVDGKSVYENDE